MIDGRKVVVVLPAYNAGATLRRTFDEIPRPAVDEVILVDDGSRDDTVEVARQLGVRLVVHPVNRGYGSNQKTCYREMLKGDGDICVMLHPDYQYAPRLVTALASMVASGEFEVVLGSRILGGGALKGGMPLYKFVANRFLTGVENLLLRAALSEYHTGFRAMNRHVLETLPLEENSDDFLFDNQFLAQTLYFGFRIGELSCPTRYFAEASTINFSRSVTYGLGVLATALQFRAQKSGLAKFSLFDPAGRKLRDCVEEGLVIPPTTWTH